MRGSAGGVAVEIPSTGPRGLRELRERNQLRVIEALRGGTPLTQAGISRITGLSRTTVSAVVVELKQQGFIRPAQLKPSAARGGRPGTCLELQVGGKTPNEGAGRPNALVDENAKLLAENTRLKSILDSIQGLVVSRAGGDAATV